MGFQLLAECRQQLSIGQQIVPD